MTATKTDHNAELADLGFTLAINSGPIGRVRDNGWPCISYNVTLEYNGRAVHSTDYSLGVGHVKWPKRHEDIPPGGDIPVFNTIRNNPGANLKNKADHATAAALLARVQKVKPDIAGVLSSLLLDGSPFFDAQSFEDWAGELGYDIDSRKAESLWRECDATGRALAWAIPANVIAKAREILQDY